MNKKQSSVLTLVGLALSVLTAAAAPVAQAATLRSSPDADTNSDSDSEIAVDATASAELSADARHVWQWATTTGDNQGQPFAVVDKRAARLYVFAADGRPLGTNRALLGQAPGDHSVPGVADGDVNRIPLADRTTPAGRFASQPGRNLNGEAIVWFDYGAALAIHRVRPGASQAQRLQRIASTSPADNRASLGCVVVTPEFYDTVVQPVLGQQRGVVYVLPEREPVQAYFGPGPLVATGR